MNKPTLLMAVVTLLLTATPQLQAQAVDPAQQTAYGITVSGHGEILAKPDVAYASLGVVTQARSQTDAAAQNATKSQAVTAALLSGGVAQADISTQYYQVQPQYDYQRSPAVLTGYQVTNMIKVAIRNLPKAGVIVDQATQAGANQVDSITYDLTDRTAVNNQALTDAVVNARAKADLMAAAGGVAVGRLINLQETTASSPGPVYPMMMRAAMAVPAPAQPPTPLAPDTIDVTADVTAMYSIGYGK